MKRWCHALSRLNQRKVKSQIDLAKSCEGERALERENRKESVQRRKELEHAIHELQKKLNEMSELLADSDALREIANSELQAIFAKYGRRRKKLEDMEEEWVALAADD